jgi:hypothetical protein
MALFGIKYPILAVDSTGHSVASLATRRATEPSEHYYLSHATIPFPRGRFLAFLVKVWLLSNYCVAIPFLKIVTNKYFIEFLIP